MKNKAKWSKLTPLPTLKQVTATEYASPEGCN